MVLLYKLSDLEDSDTEVTRKQNFSRRYRIQILTSGHCSPYHHSQCLTGQAASLE